MPPRIRPWEFQSRAAKQALAGLKRGKRVLIVSPGGSGKTIILGLVAKAAIRRGQRVLVISHRREILSQCYDRLHRLGIPEKHLGLVVADAPSEHVRPHALVQIASIQTLQIRNLTPPADVLIVDEAHHVLAERYRETVEGYRAAQQVGLTATPMRLDGRGLGDFYEELVTAASPSQLIKAKRLANPILCLADERFMPDPRP